MALLLLQRKGKGAIDLYMAVRKVGFQSAVDSLTPYSGAAFTASVPAVRPAAEPATENPPFDGASYASIPSPRNGSRGEIWPLGRSRGSGSSSTTTPPAGAPTGAKFCFP